MLSTLTDCMKWRPPEVAHLMASAYLSFRPYFGYLISDACGQTTSSSPTFASFPTSGIFYSGLIGLFLQSSCRSASLCTSTGAFKCSR